MPGCVNIARHNKTVGFIRRVMSDERSGPMNDKRGTMSSGHDRIAGPVETMRETADGLRAGEDGRIAYVRDKSVAESCAGLPVTRPAPERQT